MVRNGRRVSTDLEITLPREHAPLPVYYKCIFSMKLALFRHYSKTSHGNSIAQRISTVQFSRSVLSDSLQPINCRRPGLTVHHQLPEHTQTHVHWVGDAIQPSDPLFSLLLLPSIFPLSGSFQMSQFFTSDGQSIGVPASTSVLPMNTQDWSPLGWTGWISLKSKGFWRVFSNTTVPKHQFFGAQLSL